MTLIEQLEQLLTTASQAEIKSFLLTFINQEDEQTILSYQGFDAQAYCHYLNSLKPIEQCSCFELAQRFQQEDYLSNYPIPNREAFYDRFLLRSFNLIIGDNSIGSS